MLTFSIFSIITPFTSETWAFTLASLLISSGWSTQYCICSFSLDLYHQFVTLENFIANVRHNPFKKWKKIKPQLPKFLVQTICNCCRSFSSTISIGKIFLDSLEEGNRNLSTKSLNCNYTVCCGIQRLKLVLIYIKRNEDQRGKQNNKEFLLANHAFTVIKFLYCPTWHCVMVFVANNLNCL